MHGSLRKWYLYAFFFEPLKNPFSQLMLDEILVNKLPDLTYQGEVKGAFAESRYKSDKRLRVFYKSGNLSNSLFRLFNKYLLNLFRVRRITDAYWNR